MALGGTVQPLIPDNSDYGTILLYKNECWIPDGDSGPWCYTTDPAKDWEFCDCDVDECSANTDNCDANAVCTNTDGSFTCACNTGRVAKPKIIFKPPTLFFALSTSKFRKKICKKKTENTRFAKKKSHGLCKIFLALFEIP